MAIAQSRASSNGATDGTGAEAAREDLRQGREEMRMLGARTAEITQELRELARLEMELARAEVAENRRLLMTGAVSGASAGLLGFWVLGFLGLAMTYGLAEVWPLWAAALATAGVFLVVAGIAAMVAKSRLADFSPTPKRTMASLREDLTWVRKLLKQSAASVNSGR